jgi:hypothetical protein
MAAVCNMKILKIREVKQFSADYLLLSLSAGYQARDFTAGRHAYRQSQWSEHGVSLAAVSRMPNDLP